MGIGPVPWEKKMSENDSLNNRLSGGDDATVEDDLCCSGEKRLKGLYPDSFDESEPRQYRCSTTPRESERIQRIFPLPS